MSIEFKQGDKVRCVDAETSPGLAVELHKGEKYTVKKFEKFNNFEEVILTEFPNARLSADRFERLVPARRGLPASPQPVTVSAVFDFLKEEEGTDMNVAMKNDEKDDKSPLDFLRLDGIQGAMRVFKFGAKKYAKNNYLKGGLNASRLTAAALRHILQYQDGEELDAESGESHIDHAMCCLMMLRSTQQLGTSVDDLIKNPAE